jgi:hypothetical protein
VSDLVCAFVLILIANGSVKVPTTSITEAKDDEGEFPLPAL